MHRLLLLVVVFLLSCNASVPEFVLKVTKSNGVLQGVVFDRETGARLAGITVGVLVDGKWQTTSTSRDNTSTAIDEGGTYVLGGLPVGVNLRLSFGGTSRVRNAETGKTEDGKVYAAWFTTKMIDPVINGHDGNGTATELLLANHPMLQVDAQLVPKTAVLNGVVYGNRLDGKKPAIAGATVVLMMPSYEFTARATTDADGKFAFSELPADSIPIGNLMVLPLDLDNDKSMDFGTWLSSQVIDVGEQGTDGTNPLRIDLNEAGLAPILAWSNIDNGLDATGDPAFGHFDPTDPIRLVFSIPVDGSTWNLEGIQLFKLRGASLAGGVDQVGINRILDAEKVGLELSPVAPLERGARYYVAFTKALATANGEMVAINDKLGFIAHAGLPLLQLTSKPQVSAKDGKGVFDFNSTGLTLQWKSDDAADSYMIFAKDSSSDYLEMIPQNSSFGPETSWAVLDFSLFDVFELDTMGSTPLAAGQKITFLVIPVNAEGQWSFPAADKAKNIELTIGDSVKPIIAAIASAEVASGVLTAKGKVVVTFSEYMDTATSPKMTCVDKSVGGDKKTPPAAAITWTWTLPADAPAVPVVNSGFFSFVNTAGEIYQGDTCTIDFTGLKDGSGNAINTGNTTNTRVHVL